MKTFHKLFSVIYKKNFAIIADKQHDGNIF